VLSARLLWVSSSHSNGALESLSGSRLRPHITRTLQAYLGHKNIQHTVRYTELAPDRFKDFWR
jgi:hypothetical protein